VIDLKPHPIVYDPTDGDELAEAEAQGEEPPLKITIRAIPGGGCLDSARNPRRPARRRFLPAPNPLRPGKGRHRDAACLDL
jgi:hypothetical protein